MQEVSIRLRFIRECLGSAKRQKGQDQTVFCMPRDPRGHVMFLPSWWKSLMAYAAKVRNLGQSLVGNIDWDPIVDGAPTNWRRIIVPPSKDRKRRARYAMHEAFPPGSFIGIKAVLPDGLSLDDFQEILTTAGTYRGISPYQPPGESYGTFEVQSVKKARQKQEQNPTPITQPQPVQDG
jgi:hypothetical protein